MRTERRWPRVLMACLALAGVLALIAFRPEPTARRHPERELVRFWHLWTGEWKLVVDRIVERFNASQDRWEVIALSIPAGSIEQKFVMSVAGGEPPDVVAQLEQTLPMWAAQGLVEPLDALLKPAERERIPAELYPAARRVGTYQGRPFALPIGMNTWACFYRPAHLREVGLADQPFPATLEELMAWGRRLHRFDAEGRLARMGFSPGWLAQYAPRFGGGFWDESAQRPALATEANRAALAFIAESRDELGFDRVLRFQSSLNTGGYATEWPFISGQVSIAMDGQWRVEQLARYAPELEYRTAPLPPAAAHDPGAGYAAGNFLAIPRGARNARGALAFMRFWSGVDDPVTAADFYAWGGWLPVGPRITAAPAYQEYLREHPAMRTFVDILPSPRLQTAPPVPYQVFLLDEIRRAEDAAVRGTATPSEALAELEEAVAHEVERRRRLGAPR
jgi:multiple sugar transport system substrate-binding protein